jgi:hypothetical protein
MNSLLTPHEGLIHPVKVLEVRHLLSHRSVVVTVKLQHLVFTLG